MRVKTWFKKAGESLKLKAGDFMEYKRSSMGIEFTKHGMKVAIVEKKGGKCHIKALKHINFPQQIYKFSYKHENIVNPEQFKEMAGLAVKMSGRDKIRAGISLPNEIIKTFIQKFDELPDHPDKVRKMVVWWLEKSLGISLKNVEVSYDILGKDDNGKTGFLITIGYRKVIREYENYLKEVNMEPVLIRPANINQFNFYLPLLPETKTIAFIGCFAGFFYIMVIKNGKPIFYQGVKKGVSDPFFLHHLDMLKEQYQAVFPDDPVEEYYMVYPGELYWDLSEELNDMLGNNLIIMDENDLVTFEHGHDLNNGDGQFSITRFCSAIGAAQGLARYPFN